MLQYYYHLRRLLRRYFPVMMIIARSSLKAEAAKTLGGYLWWVAEPIIYSCVYYFVFAVVFESRTENFIAFLLLGVTTWRWLQSTISQSSNAVVSSSNYMRIMHVPKIIFPVQKVLENSIKFTFALIVMMIIIFFLKSVDISAFHYFPIVFFVSLMFIMSFGVFFSAIVPFVPDVLRLMGFMFRGLLFVSGIFFDSSRIPDEYLFYFYLNPFAVLIESFRKTLMFGETPDLIRLAAIFAVSILVGAAGLAMHIRYNRVYPKFL